MSDIKFDRKEIRELEKFLLKRVEDIIFNEHKRPSGEKKVKGGLLVEDDTGKLRRKLKANRNFIKQTDNGIEINIKMMDYFKWLDDERAEKFNWYFSEAIFEDKEVRKTMKEITAKATKRVLLKIIKEA